MSNLCLRVKSAVTLQRSQENLWEKGAENTSKRVIIPTQVNNTNANVQVKPKNYKLQNNNVHAALHTELVIRLRAINTNGLKPVCQNNQSACKVQMEILTLKREYELLRPAREAAEREVDAKVAAAQEAEAKRIATEVEAAAASAAAVSRAQALLKRDGNGIPPPPPPPPVDKLPQKSPTSINARVPGKSNPTGPADNFVQKQLIDELKSKLLLRRADEANITDKNTTDPLLMTTTDRPLPEWKKELAEHKASYARDAVLRKAAEAKEEARVARNLEEEEGKRNIEAQQKAAEAAEAAKAAEVRNALVHRDERGIPLPPPLPAYK